MSGSRSASVLGQIRSLFGRGSLGGVGEGRLLERFVVHGDEDAFEALMARHGPMVLGVCRRLLDDPRDAEDAFQATFLVLIQKAGSLRDGDLLANWLYGVAHRVATRARANAIRRNLRERPGAEEATVSDERPGDRADLRSVLDDELARLPDRLRAVVVLCDLEGMPQDEAATRLGCPIGTIKSRLSRARDRLRGRLLRRGIAPSLLTAAILNPADASASVPASLASATLRVASGATASAPVAALVQHLLRGMIMSKMKLAASASLALILLSAGAMTLHSRAAPEAPQAPRPEPIASPATAPSPSPSKPDPRPGKTFPLFVISQVDKKPIANAEVQMRVWEESPSEWVMGLKTDANGRCPIPIPDRSFLAISIGAFRDGFVPLGCRLSPGEIDAARPEDATLELEIGCEIGGIVRDEAGKPVAGARVSTLDLGRHSTRPRDFIFRPEGGVVTTDADGRWRVSILPSTTKGRIAIGASHADYANHLGLLTEIRTIEEARAMTDVLVLKRGFPLAGSVTDPEGRAIAGASVFVPLDPNPDQGYRTLTDAEGHFRLGHVDTTKHSDEVEVQVGAPGFAPTSVWIRARGDISPLAIRLTKGRPFRGRVVDRKGAPIADAAITLISWEHFVGLDRRVHSDPEGHFVLADLPTSGSLYFRVRKPGFAIANRLKLAVTAPEPILTLHRPLIVRGSVVDAETGRPIPEFDVVPAETPDPLGGSQATWTLSRVMKGIQGQYEYRPQTDLPLTRFLRVEARDYLPSVSRAVAVDEEEIVIDFRLRKGRVPELSGVVRSPDGTPLQGAEVYQRVRSSPIHLRVHDGPPRLSSSGAKAVTDNEGKFTIKAPAKSTTLLVLHDRGFAELDSEMLAGSPDLTIEPWGRIEGTIRVGSKPGSEAPIQVIVERSSKSRLNGQSWVYEVEADSQGLFAIDRIFPGDRAVVHRRNSREQDHITVCRTPPFAIRPGETARVKLGGAGRPIVGRLIRPEGSPDMGFIDFRGRLRIKLPDIPRPEAAAAWTAAQEREFLAKYADSPAGRDRQQIMAHMYEVRIDPDGRFRIDDVPSGEYELSASIVSKASVAMASRDVVMPEIPRGRSDEPLVLEDLRLVPMEEPPGGKP